MAWSYCLIYQGDALHLMAKGDGMKSIITDPIWPNHSKVFKCEDAAAILWTTLSSAPKSVERVVIVMGGDSDPRWMREAVPMKYPFLKTCFLEFCVPVKKGRNLYTHLMAYAFGQWPKSKQGARVIPTKCLSRETEKRLTWHPTPMRVSHAKWLVKWWGDGGVIDPFAGSGTIGEACIEHSIPYIGFEINEEYCKRANERLENVPKPFC
jgi:DNA methylase